MKVAIILAGDGSAGQDAILAPYRSASFLAGLESCGAESMVIHVSAHEGDGATAGTTSRAKECHVSVRSIGCADAGLAAVLAAERPDVIQTFGPERRLAQIWAIAAGARVPMVHFVTAWRQDAPDRNRAPASTACAISRTVATLARSPTKRASCRVDAVIGSSRAAVGSLVAAGYFPRAAFSVIVAPPVERGAPAAGAAPRRSEPVFGIYDPDATAATLAFVAHAIALMGRSDTAPVQVALRQTPRDAAVAAALTPVEAAGIDEFLESIDILAVPAFDDAAVAPLIAALRSGKSVIVPDCGGAAELIEYGRHGVMFAAGSAYHFANALNLVSQSWSQTAVLRREGGPAVARTEPTAVAATFVNVYRRLLVANRPGPSSSARQRTASS